MRLSLLKKCPHRQVCLGLFPRLHFAMVPSARRSLVEVFPRLRSLEETLMLYSSLSSRSRRKYRVQARTRSWGYICLHQADLPRDHQHCPFSTINADPERIGVPFQILTAARYRQAGLEKEGWSLKTSPVITGRRPQHFFIDGTIHCV